VPAPLPNAMATREISEPRGVLLGTDIGRVTPPADRGLTIPAKHHTANTDDRLQNPQGLLIPLPSVRAMSAQQTVRHYEEHEGKVRNPNPKGEHNEPAW